MTTVDETKQESRAFEADVAKLLHMMVHSVYSDKDIFLRELISNAADACERLRMLALEKPELLASDPDFKIRLSAGSGKLVVGKTQMRPIFSVSFTKEGGGH